MRLTIVVNLDFLEHKYSDALWNVVSNLMARRQQRCHKVNVVFRFVDGGTECVVTKELMVAYRRKYGYMCKIYCVKDYLMSHFLLESLPDCVIYMLPGNNDFELCKSIPSIVYAYESCEKPCGDLFILASDKIATPTKPYAYPIIQTPEPDIDEINLTKKYGIPNTAYVYAIIVDTLPRPYVKDVIDKVTKTDDKTKYFIFIQEGGDVDDKDESGSGSNIISLQCGKNQTRMITRACNCLILGKNDNDLWVDEFWRNGNHVLIDKDANIPPFEQHSSKVKTYNNPFQLYSQIVNDGDGSHESFRGYSSTFPEMIFENMAIIAIQNFKKN